MSASACRRCFLAVAARIFTLVVIALVFAGTSSAGFINLVPGSSSVDPGDSIVVTEDVTFVASDVAGRYNVAGFNL